MRTIDTNGTGVIIAPRVKFKTDAFFRLAMMPRFVPVTSFRFASSSGGSLCISRREDLHPALLPTKRACSVIA